MKVKYGTGKAMLLVVLYCVCFIALVSCQSIAQVSTAQTDGLFTEVVKGQTAIAASGKEIADTSKVLTDTVTDIANAGTVTKEQIKTLVVYTDKNTGLVAQVKTLNEKIDQQGLVIDQTSKSRLSDNASFSAVIAQKIEAYKAEQIKASTRLGWALIATGIALVLAGIIWLPKIIKKII
jgi:ribosomal protein L10